MDTLTAELTVRNQSSAIAEAEELIRTWLEGVENSGIPPGAGSVSPSHDLPSSHVPIEAWGTTEEVQAARLQHRGHILSHHTSAKSSTLTASNRSGHPPHGFMISEVTKRPVFGMGGRTELEGGGAKGGDFLSGLDLSEGDVRDNTKAVLQGLLDKPLAREATTKKKASHDPRVTMEMRHREVKDRRRVRDQSRTQTLHSQLAAREARREAEMLVWKEERECKRKARQEEALVRGQMATIRREMREERERRRILQAPPPLVLEVGPLDTSDREAVMRFAGECVREGERERKRVESRAELLRQLQEAEATEAKENLKLLHRCFSSWYTAVVEHRAHLGKAAAVCDWKLLLRTWRAWQTFVGQRKERREREAIARELQREKSRLDLASTHHRRWLMLRCLSSWLCVARAGLAAKQEERELGRRRERMAAFLQAAAEGKLTREGNSKNVSPPDMDRPQEPVLAESGTPSTGGTTKPSTAGSRGPPVARATKPSAARGRGPATTRGQPTIWQTARQQLDQLLSEAAHRAQEERRTRHTSPDAPPSAVMHQETAVGPSLDRRLTKIATEEERRDQVEPEEERRDREEPEEERRDREEPEGGAEDRRRPAAKGSTPVAVREMGGAHNSNKAANVSRKPQPKPVTRPIPMSGMEARSAELAHRRALREERRREVEQQRLAEKEREDAEHRRAESEAREAHRAKLREDRRLAKQRELELQQRQQRLVELTARADAHRATVLLRTRGVLPWRRFVDTMRRWRQRAEEFHTAYLVRGVFVRWRRLSEARVREKEAIAEGFYRRIVLARALQGWRQYMSHFQRLEELAGQERGVLLQRRILRAWQRAAREGRVELWTWERRARDHHNRSLKCRTLLAWWKFVPLSREEKSKELRRADLRRKVAAWLPDYQPRRLGGEDA